MPIKHSQSFQGYTMVEVIVAAIVFSVSVAVVFGTIANTRTPTVDSDRKLAAVTYGEKVLEDLRGKIDADSWSSGSGAFTNGLHTMSASDPNFPGMNYTYFVQDMGGVRKITLNVNY